MTYRLSRYEPGPAAAIAEAERGRAALQKNRAGQEVQPARPKCWVITRRSILVPFVSVSAVCG